MMYGFWGEGHTSDWRSPFPDRAVAERTFLDMTRRQMAAWKRVPLAVNTQPDISQTGNAAVLEARDPRRVLAALGQRHPGRARSRSSSSPAGRPGSRS